MEIKEGEEKNKGGHKTRGCTGDKESTARPRQQRCIIVNGCLLIGQGNEKLKITPQWSLTLESQPVGKLCFYVWL